MNWTRSEPAASSKSDGQAGSHRTRRTIRSATDASVPSPGIREESAAATSSSAPERRRPRLISTRASTTVASVLSLRADRPNAFIVPSRMSVRPIIPILAMASRGVDQFVPGDAARRRRGGSPPVYSWLRQFDFRRRGSDGRSRGSLSRPAPRPRCPLSPWSSRSSQRCDWGEPAVSRPRRLKPSCPPSDSCVPQSPPEWTHQGTMTERRTRARDTGHNRSNAPDTRVSRPTRDAPGSDAGR